MPKAKLRAILNTCKVTGWRLSAKELREINRLNRRNIEQSRKIHEHFRKLLTEKGKSQVPTLHGILGKKPKPKKPSIPLPEFTPSEKAQLRPQPKPIVCKNRPGQGKCDCCGAQAGPFKCPTFKCDGPTGNYWMAGTARINAKDVQPFTSDRLIKLINSPGVCGSPEGIGYTPIPKWWEPWKRPATLQPKPSRPQGGAPKLPIGPIRPGPLAPIPTPQTPGGIPGQQPGDVCGHATNAAFRRQVFLCRNSSGDSYVSQGQRRPVSSFVSVDAVIAWVNSL